MGKALRDNLRQFILPQLTNSTMGNIPGAKIVAYVEAYDDISLRTVPE